MVSPTGGVLLHLVDGYKIWDHYGYLEEIFQTLGAFLSYQLWHWAAVQHCPVALQLQEIINIHPKSSQDGSEWLSASMTYIESVISVRSAFLGAEYSLLPWKM